MASLPGLTQLRWYQQKWFSEAVALFPPIITVAATGTIYIHDSAKRISGYCLFFAAGWLFIAGLIKVSQANQEDKKRREKESPQDLLGCAMVLHRAVCHTKGIADTDDSALRVTIHRVVPAKSVGDEPQELEQILPYVGTPGGKSGRRTSIRSGVVGHVIRGKDTFRSHRQTEQLEDYLNELVRDFGYTLAEAQALTPGRWSAIGVPLYDAQVRDTVVGVVFLDSFRRDFFDDGTTALITAACYGINEYVTRRFAS